MLNLNVKLNFQFLNIVGRVVKDHGLQEQAAISKGAQG